MDHNDQCKATHDESSPVTSSPKPRALTSRKTAHHFSFQTLVGGEYIRMSDYAGKVMLVVNVASHCNSTGREYLQLNELASKYPDLVILGFPCNQFGHQENLNREEIYLSLKHIRPGNGFEPAFPLSAKVEVNGANSHPLFHYLKVALPFPNDRDLVGEMASPGTGVFSHPMRIIWMPVSRADITWNFEKFLINREGIPMKRFSPNAKFEEIEAEIKELLGN